MAEEKFPMTVKGKRALDEELKHLMTVERPTISKAIEIARGHGDLKENADYQRTAEKYRFEFPPGSAWMVFTDVVPHSVHSGRYALEQTVIVNRDSLSDRARAPIAILENLCGTRL